MSSPAQSPESLLAAGVFVFLSSLEELGRGVGERGVHSPEAGWLSLGKGLLP